MVGTMDMADISGALRTNAESIGGPNGVAPGMGGKLVLGNGAARGGENTPGGVADGLKCLRSNMVMAPGGGDWRRAVEDRGTAGVVCTIKLADFSVLVLTIAVLIDGVAVPGVRSSMVLGSGLGSKAMVATGGVAGSPVAPVGEAATLRRGLGAGRRRRPRGGSHVAHREHGRQQRDRRADRRRGRRGAAGRGHQRAAGSRSGSGALGEAGGLVASAANAGRPEGR